SPRRWRGAPPALVRHLDKADVILHAGAVCTPDVLDLLSAYAPVHVVMGSNDVPEVADWGAPEPLELRLARVAVGSVPGSGPRAAASAAAHGGVAPGPVTSPRCRARP